MEIVTGQADRLENDFKTLSALNFFKSNSQKSLQIQYTSV
jgi:hypothetical protein